jgi:hypothetical protein
LTGPTRVISGERVMDTPVTVSGEAGATIS